MGLIEQEALLRRLRSHYNRVAGGGTIYTPSMMLAITDAERAPTIDPIHAAGGYRCGECKWYMAGGVCGWTSSDATKNLRSEDDFCSDGEPREVKDDG